MKKEIKINIAILILLAVASFFILKTEQTPEIKNQNIQDISATPTIKEIKDAKNEKQVVPLLQAVQTAQPATTRTIEQNTEIWINIQAKASIGISWQKTNFLKQRLLNQ